MPFDYEADKDRILVEWSQHAWDGAVGQEFDFYGVAAQQFKLGDTVWEAVEDPSDGYRSHLGFIAIADTSAGPFFQTPIARVRVEHYVGEKGGDDYDRTNQVDFFYLRDTADGHIWLTVGTDNTDDYYPVFRFVYEPNPKNRYPPTPGEGGKNG